MSTRTLQWVKGHGTENDFVLVLDPDGTAYPDLDATIVRELCDRRRGIGADGVLRVVRTSATDDGRRYADAAEWFMDYRNADGSIGEMCGNGVRVFVRFLLERGLVEGTSEVPVATRAGVKPVRLEPDGQLTVGMGPATFPESSGLTISAGGRSWPAVAVDMGNPHAVAMVDDLTDPGALLDPPVWTPAEVFPKGVNAEFAVRRGDHHVAMRVHERGVGETRSCGTGACAVAARVAAADGVGTPVTYRVDVPGGTLSIGLRADGEVELTGPAELTVRGEFDL
ncbi:diaminopimelate epimerase [Actinopolymorpha pittospori]|uniref:Diaminopimelate epimerase n=1 Tax=Actinopolymorpha pittospori TaxID=648752 RepID=A0A927N3L5_9ACTN|nr:diaminopimelate epimerase [Actinopolymorpha pittospori]